MSETSEDFQFVGNVPSDTRWCRAFKSSTGEEGGSYDVSIEMLKKPSTLTISLELFGEVELCQSLCLRILGHCCLMFCRPEYVAECFLKLVETGQNGDVMIVSSIYTPSAA